MGRATWDFSGETAVVTGGSSGIGRAIALRLGRAGAAVVVADVRQDPIGPDNRPTDEVLADEGEDAAFVETDVTDPTDVQAAVERAREFDGLDLMFNNAGVSSTESVLEASREDFRRVFDTDVFGVLTGCRLAAEELIDRGDGGAIVNTASIRSEFASPNHVQYDAAKGAVEMVTRCAAFELAEHGIRINAVAPGPIATHGRESETADELREQVARGEYTKPIPQGRAGDPEEVASAAAYLASEEASYTTGELLFVDGGYQVY